MIVGHHYEIIKRRGRESFLGRLVGRLGDSDIYRFDYIRIHSRNRGWQEDGPQSEHRDFYVSDYEFIPLSHEHYW